MPALIDSYMPRLDCVTPRRFASYLLTPRILTHWGLALAAFVVLYCGMSLGLDEDGRALVAGRLLALAIGFTAIGVAAAYLLMTCVAWFVPVRVQLGPDKISLRCYDPPTDPRHYPLSAADVIYADLRNPHRPFLIFPHGVLPPPVPIHPGVDVAALADLFARNRFHVIRPHAPSAGRRVQVAATSPGESTFPGSITFAFRGAITPAQRDAVAAVVTGDPLQMLLPPVEFPERRAIRVAVNPALVPGDRQGGVCLVQLLLDRIEEWDVMVRSLSCVLLEESAEAPPPVLLVIPPSSSFARFTIALFRPALKPSRTNQAMS
jgi:hypothetical protein